AVLAGRDYVVPEDVKEFAVPALSHRISLRPEVWLRRREPSQIVAELLANTTAPASGMVPTYRGAPRAPTTAAGAAPARAAREGRAGGGGPPPPGHPGTGHSGRCRGARPPPRAAPRGDLPGVRLGAAPGPAPRHRAGLPAAAGRHRAAPGRPGAAGHAVRA